MLYITTPPPLHLYYVHALTAYLDREVDGEPADHAIRVRLGDNACNIIIRMHNNNNSAGYYSKKVLLTESEVIIEYSVEVSSKAVENMGLLDWEPKNCIALIIDRGI